ncbi:MAG: TetR/AcrR family transcriptional regulator [Phenylobacterium sp.]|jgi:AcrR family transcriptional regulator|uniref:TetR/AcrR family transcriptional regulator n=1 Tax=Phenylobacterium sp. TaxID=1871053 RepID=UPI002A36E858|nr:TetR/AcrR family transcriptional regulator [Phenylobacterium sp.]MDX9998437.1 TetR/AcrR family transcriptional regulator [Phenylobacterium sp.]
MPRVAGQIDQAKSEAILDAAAQVLFQRGFSASVAEIARQAGVSKQTVYNHFGGKAELVRALAERRVHQVTAPLEAADAAEHPRDALAAYARILLEAVATPNSVGFMRLAVQSSVRMPEVGRVLYEAGPRASAERLAEFLAEEHEAGRLNVPDPLLAAEIFRGMAIGSWQIAGLLGVGREITPVEIDRIAEEAADRFMRAYG